MSFFKCTNLPLDSISSSLPYADPAVLKRAAKELTKTSMEFIVKERNRMARKELLDATQSLADLLVAKADVLLARKFTAIELAKANAYLHAANEQMSEQSETCDSDIVLTKLIKTVCVDLLGLLSTCELVLSPGLDPDFSELALHASESVDLSDPFVLSEDYVREDHNDLDFFASHTQSMMNSSICVHGPNNDISLSELLHPQPEDDDPSGFNMDFFLQANEAVPSSLSKFGKRANTPPNLAVCGAKTPGSKSVLASAPCNK